MDKPTSIRARIVTERAATTSLTAYLFDRDGALLARVRPDADGAVAIGAEHAATADRLIIGPELAAPTVPLLTRLGGVEASAARLAASPATELRVHDALVLRWVACLVRGVLVKQVTVDGTTFDLPVPGARLEVYEVDPLRRLLTRLPPERFERLRDLLRRPPIDPPPVEVPRPFPPRPEPVEAEASPAVKLAMAVRAAQAEPALVAAAEVGSRVALEAALLRYEALLRPILCLLYPQVSMVKVAETTTDELGRFATTFVHDTRGDTRPDLYFRGYQTVGGVEVQIYGPRPIGCHTHWDYACGSELVLRTRDPRAVTGGRTPGVDGPPSWGVAFVGVGAASTAELGGVFTASGSELDPTTPVGRRFRGAGASAPWGGALGLRFEFAQALQALGAVYYRVTWRRAGSMVEAPLLTPITHYYKTETTRPDGSKTLAWIGEPMGPVPATAAIGGLEGLCRIPYPSIATAKGGVWDTPTGGGAIRAHLTSASFDSVAHAPGGTSAPGSAYDAGADRAGRYELMVSLHKADGSELVLGAHGRTYVAARQEEVVGPVTIIETAAVGAHLLEAGRLKITLDLDNNHCSAALAAPTVDGATAADCCGVLAAATGAATVALGYIAGQPHGNDTFTLSIARAARTLSVGASGTGAVTGSLSRSASDLMTDQNDCATVCKLAGFAEHLYVAATATDGWSRLSDRDAAAMRAFVLTTP